MKKKYVGFVIYNAVIVIALIAFLTIKKSDMIIYLGVNMADMIYIVFWIVLGLAFIIGNLLLLRSALKERKVTKEADAPVPVFTKKEYLSPDEIRSELMKYKDLGPHLKVFVDTVYAQMDSMDRKQEKLKRIFDRNQVDTLTSVEATVDQAEQALCRNIVKILNRIIIWDPMEANKAGKETIYAQHSAYIDKHIEINEEILSKCDVLLSETVEYVNGKDADIEGSRFHLDVMTETMQTLKAMNHAES